MAQATSDNLPQLTSARATCHLTGPDAGSIRIDCELPHSFTADDVLGHFRLELPGELSPLRPTDVLGQNGLFAIGFFSSDLTNSGHLPADCQLGWEAADGKFIPLQHIPLESGAAVRHRDGEVAARVPGLHGSVYPRTVGLVAILALLIGMIAIGVFAVTNV